MRSRTRQTICSGLFFLALSSPLSAYTIIDLGNLGVEYAIGNDINASSQVVGDSVFEFFTAFLYEDGTMQILVDKPGLTLRGTESYATGINDSGQVTGWYLNGMSDFHPFLYDGDTLQDLGTLGGRDAFGHDVNSSGYVVGSSQITPGESAEHAFLYDGSMHDLGTLGGASSTARAINDIGDVVGSARNSSGLLRAFIYNGSTLRDLGTLGGDSSFAEAINASGIVVGGSTTTEGVTHAFLYDGSMHDLGTLGAEGSAANGINDSGLVVGRSGDHAFLYDGGTMHNLCALVDCVTAGWDGLVAANAINNSGHITGYGMIGGLPHAFLIFPDLNINIDIRPGNPRNSINPWSNGQVWVAALSESGFQFPFDPASQIDIPEMEFGPQGAKPVQFLVKDVNRDGIGDLLMKFKIAETGISEGDTEVTLAGKTIDGQNLAGVDSVEIVGKKPVVICDPKVGCQP